MITRRRLVKLAGLALAAAAVPWREPRWRSAPDWRDLLADYHRSAAGNIVEVGGRRALLASPAYPGMYVRDALFWGPLGLGDPGLGLACYEWFAESQFPSGQVRSAVPLRPGEAPLLQPNDDDGTLLFVIASDWLARSGLQLDAARIEAAYDWVQAHVRDDAYISPAGPFHYWADTVNPDTPEAIAYNQGLLCLARRAMVRLGLGGVSAPDVAAAQARYRACYDPAQGYVRLGAHSNFADAQDLSAVFPEFLSRYLYGEAILADEVVVSHVDRIAGNAGICFNDGYLAGLKVISAPDGSFLPPGWFHAPRLNPAGNYQNGAHWPLFSIAALALAYAAARRPSDARMIGQMVMVELAADHRSKEFIRLEPGNVGSFDAFRSDYSWNALVPAACRWCGLA